MKYSKQRLNHLIHEASWLNSHSRVRIILVCIVIVLLTLMLIVSHKLIRRIADEERTKMEIWSKATEAIMTEDRSLDLELKTLIIRQNQNVPIILVDEQGHIISSKNIKFPLSNQDQFIYEKLQEFRESYPPLVLELPSGTQYVYYSDSDLLLRLQLLPYIQAGIFILVLGIAILAITSLKRADQNRIWEGLSRETAHQLGTPISSLMAWRELLGEQETDPMIIEEMGKDIERLEMIADRFQKIGSVPKLEEEDLGMLLERSVDYLKPRISAKVGMQIVATTSERIIVPMSAPLVMWVVENLVKNAVDAMQAQGSITLIYGLQGSLAYLDIVDTGRGIPRGRFETIFRPGYSTRQRGWGLGLSLARRIVEDYHGGRIFVKQSSLGAGTTFRVLLPLLSDNAQNQL